ncbi:MAG: hypothetical protein JWP15_3199 [Alphaproteobacteria bacterium]|nr:hypothetical protein [Alphaproteobacteria bacterium]
MRRTPLFAAASALLLAAAPQGQASPQSAGDTFVISLARDTAQSSAGSQSSTHDQDSIVERVIRVRAEGIELEYDLPGDADPDSRAAQWQYPVRVFQPGQGARQLLNRAELEARRDEWLRGANLTRESCGHWIFTWNAFRIECDPQSAIDALQPFILDGTGLAEGAAYRDRAARAPGKLGRIASGYRARMDVDPETVRRERAESDVAAGEIMRKPVTLPAALAARAKESVSGTVTVSLDVEPDGQLLRRTRVTRVEIRRADGEVETDTATETVERRPMETPPARPARDVV